MLVVDADRRYTIDQCLNHPWLTSNGPGVNDSTGGLVGGIADLEVNRRAPARERTLLSSLNSVQVTAQLPAGQDKSPVKVFAKNSRPVTNATKEAAPSANRAPQEFMEMGGKGDQELFPDDSASIYPSQGTVTANPKKGKSNGR
jgi:serine/threonine-protein kinase CHEK2